MKKIIKILSIFVFTLFYLNTFAETWEMIVNESKNADFLNNIQTSSEEQTKVEDLNEPIQDSQEEKPTVDLDEELKKDGIELDSAPLINEDKTLVDKANDFKNKEFEKLLWKSEEEKNIEAIQTVLNELEIKKELNASQLSEIQANLKVLQDNIAENNKNINILKEWKNVRELSKELEEIEKNNALLRNELKFKQELINDLQDSIAWYNILEAKYKKLLESYVDSKKEKENSILKDKEQKLITLFICLILFLIAYIIKTLLIWNERFVRKHENFWEYFNFMFWISLVIFLVLFTFYLFPELYAILILISWSLIFINAQVISSFVASLILFKNFKIWDVIKIWTEKWKIIKMTTLSTVIKKINDYWIIENEEVSIPNIDLLKEKVTLAKNSLIKENIFNIILPLNWKKDIFEMVDYIKDNIFIKLIKDKLNTLNPLSSDIFKTKYEHIDSDKIKITFYWLWKSELNRKIEKEIIKYIKEFSSFDTEVWTNKSNIKKNVSKSQEWFKKASIIQDEVTS